MIAIVFAGLLTAIASEPVTADVVVVVGAPGTPEYGRSFTQWADNWQDAGRRSGARVVRIEGGGTPSARDRLRAAVTDQETDRPLWLVLIGHGTFDQRTARFNLVGPDVSAAELAEWIPADRPAAIINCASASAPFINRLSGKNRVIVTATKSGQEHNYARFGGFLSEVIADPGVDLDKDGQTSLLEAWLIAARRTQDFYAEAGRLATEHALIDDNADERGTRYDAFRGVRPVARTDGAALDGFRAHQWHLLRGSLERSMPPQLLAERDELEMAVFRLREHRSDFRQDQYYSELEQLLIPLATLYEQAEAAQHAGGQPDAPPPKPEAPQAETPPQAERSAGATDRGA